MMIVELKLKWDNMTRSAIQKNNHKLSVLIVDIDVIGKKEGVTDYVCNHCKKVIDNIDAFSPSWKKETLVRNTYYNVEVSDEDDDYGDIDKVESEFYCGHCDNLLTNSRDVAEAILLGYDIDAGRTGLIYPLLEEHEEGEQE